MFIELLFIDKETLWQFFQKRIARQKKNLIAYKKYLNVDQTLPTFVFQFFLICVFFLNIQK